jgi:putative ABC transport system permease protein
MIKHYFKIAWRNLKIDKTFSAINIIGLSIGMAACLLILSYVSFERSYDTFHVNRDNLYRVTMQHTTNDGHKFHLAPNYAATAPAITASIPEVKAVTRLYVGGESILLCYKEKVLADNKLGYADATFLQMFTYPLLSGDARTALSEPNTIVLTETMSKKLFGNENPIGKTLNFKEGRANLLLEVTGILKDIPLNSHQQFSALVSFKTFIQEVKGIEENWGWCSFHTYILANPRTHITTLQAKINALLEKKKGDMFKKLGVHEDFFVQPVKNIYLYSKLKNEQNVNGNAKTIKLWLLLALIISAIAWINYVNLYTSKAIKRAKEVGVRKATGANQWQLIKQFLFESLLLNFISTVIAILLVQLFLPAFNLLMGKPVSIHFWSNPIIWITLSGLFIIGALGTGIYPAFVLSSFDPVKVLKGKFSNTGRGVALRKGLVVLQFTVSISLIIGTCMIYRQIQFMNNADLGMDVQQIVVIEAPIASGSKSAFTSNLNTFKNRLLTNPAIKNVTATGFVPGNKSYLPGDWGSYIRRVGSKPTEVRTYKTSGIDYNFLPTLGMRILAGRNFSPNFPGDKEAVLVSKAAVKELGFKTPQQAIGKTIYYPLKGEQDFKPISIIGVFDDIHVETLQRSISPLIFELDLERRGFILAKVNTAQLANTLAFLKKEYEKTFSGNSFQYFFLDDSYTQQYQTDRQFAILFGFFSGLAIFIACLGLIGLVSFTMLQKTKEIGIRKVLGASISSILTLLSKDFIKLILLANIVAWPFAYYALQVWLLDYAYKINLSQNLWIFLLAGFLAMIIMFCTVSFQALKAALTNPVKSLRME